MRTRPENKAESAPGASPATCPRCGRDVGEYSCRDVRDGWFCLADGLQADPARMIEPSLPEPTKAEKKTMDAYAAALTTAEHAVDTALAAYTTAEQTLNLARIKAAAAKRGTGKVRYNRDYQVITDGDSAERRDAIEAEAEALEGCREASTRLAEARIRLNQINNARYRDLLTARATGQPQSPSKRTLRRLVG